MRVISDKLVFYEIDGDAASGRQGELSEWTPTLVKAAGERDPSILSLSGRRSQHLSHKNPDPIDFQHQEHLSSARQPARSCESSDLGSGGPGRMQKPSHGLQVAHSLSRLQLGPQERTAAVGWGRRACRVECYLGCQVCGCHLLGEV